MTNTIFVALLICIAPLDIICGRPKKLKSEKIVKEINNDPNSTWKADTYGTQEIDVDWFSDNYLGEKSTSVTFSKAETIIFDLNKKPATSPAIEQKLPKIFNWANPNTTGCPVGRVRLQSNCGSCWAVSTVSAMQDRFCIQSKGKVNVEFSSGYVLSCNLQNYGCSGGYSDYVYNFLRDNGTITGGDYDSDEGCQPYPIRPCGPFVDSIHPPCAYRTALTPKCRQKKCYNDWYKYRVEPESNTFRYKKWSSINGNISFTTEYLMRKDMYDHGPITANFLVCSNFFYYKKGIYRPPRWCWPLGFHAVKVVGWGEEDDIRYWIVQNSWSDRWGEKGYFRIIRGIDAVFFESGVKSGTPNLEGK